MAHYADHATIAETTNYEAQYMAKNNMYWVYKNGDAVVDKSSFISEEKVIAKLEALQAKYDAKAAAKNEAPAPEAPAAETTPATEVEAQPTSEPKATTRQISFIIDLMRQGRDEGCWYGGNRDLDTLTKKQASLFISAMLDS